MIVYENAIPDVVFALFLLSIFYNLNRECQTSPKQKQRTAGSHETKMHLEKNYNESLFSNPRVL